MRNVMKNYFLEEDAIGVVEIILILVILIALVLIFKTKITSVVTKAFTNFTRDTGKMQAFFQIFCNLFHLCAKPLSEHEKNSTINENHPLTGE